MGTPTTTNLENIQHIYSRYIYTLQIPSPKIYSSQTTQRLYGELNEQPKGSQLKKDSTMLG